MRRSLIASTVLVVVLGWPVGLAGAASSGASTAVVGPWTHARGFLGPIGWFWNNIYYRVFGGEATNMAVFGWALFISPVILVVAMRTVLSGTKGSLGKPVVPESIRTRVS